MIEDIIRQVLPTATGFAARQAIATLRKRNIEVAPLLGRVGLSERDFDNLNFASPLSPSKASEYVAEALGDSAFGCISPSRPIYAKQDCCSMSPPLQEPSARRCRFTDAIAGSSMKRCG